MAVLWRTLLIIWFATSVTLAPVSVSPTHAIQKRLPDDLRTLIDQGQPNDEVLLVVTLKTPYSNDERPNDVRLGVSQRQIIVRQAQQLFVQRQAGRVTVRGAQPIVTPMVFVMTNRDYIATLYNDDAVAQIALDQPTPLAMYTSGPVIGLEQSHTSGYDGSGTAVAVLDTGVYKSHEFLRDQVVAEACFSTNSDVSTSYCPGGVSSSTVVGSGAPCTGLSSCWHGTHVAGTIAGNISMSTTGYAMRGVAPGANIIAIQVFSYFINGSKYCSSPAGCVLSWTSDQIRALDWLYAYRNTSSWGKLVAVNMSLGGADKYTTACDVVDSRTTPINQLRSVGIATIIASGNSGFIDGVSAPACISTAIAVGATTVTNPEVVASFSNAPSIENNLASAPGDRLLDLLAPGQSIYSSVSSSTTAYATLSGTSMATPHVAGAWAVLKQVAPAATVAQIKRILAQTGTPITDSRNGVILPRIHVYDAVMALNPQPFVRVNPLNNRLHTSSTIQLQWSASVFAAEYEYCLVRLNRGCTNNWVNVGLVRRVTVANLVHGVTYKWSVRAKNAVSGIVVTGPMWQFNVQLKPASFRKSWPDNQMTNRQRPPQLSWQASARATSYEYCIATTGPACTNWKNVGLNRRVTVYGLQPNTTYVWQVRARNAAGVTVATEGRWRFTTNR